MSFFDNTFRDCKATLDPTADKKPGQLNETSVADANATPATIGKSEPMIPQVGTSPRMDGVNATEKNGSVDLTVCVKATDTLPSDIFVSMKPAPWNNARGSAVDKRVFENLGGFLIRKIQRDIMMKPATRNWMTVQVRGKGKTLRICLL